MAPIVTLTTDFGLKDPYVGQMKAALLSVAPDLRIVDLTHEIAAQNVLEAAFVLETSWRYFPEGTVHVVVVDPGVGSERKRLILGSGGHWFVGPDNGCLSAALAADARGWRGPSASYRAQDMPVPAGVAARLILGSEQLPRRPSATFEGRDVFAPVAALLASGRDADTFGPQATSLLAFPRFRAPTQAGEVFGMVLRTDRFGNLITDIFHEDVYPGSRVRISGKDLPLARTYAEAGGPAALIGSSGYLEVALPNGSAAEALGAGTRTSVVCVTHT
jgi:S-adenosylmethionine hydrolase